MLFASQLVFCLWWNITFRHMFYFKINYTQLTKIYSSEHVNNSKCPETGLFRLSFVHLCKQGGSQRVSASETQARHTYLCLFVYLTYVHILAACTYQQPCGTIIEQIQLSVYVHIWVYTHARRPQTAFDLSAFRSGTNANASPAAERRWAPGRTSSSVTQQVWRAQHRLRMLVGETFASFSAYLSLVLRSHKQTSDTYIRCTFEKSTHTRTHTTDVR